MSDQTFFSSLLAGLREAVSGLPTVPARPAADATHWHNPENISEPQLGRRFLTKDESATLNFKGSTLDSSFSYAVSTRIVSGKTIGAWRPVFSGTMFETWTYCVPMNFDVLSYVTGKP